MFQATDHLLTGDQGPFNPKYPLSESRRIALGSLLRTIYYSSPDNEQLQEYVQHIYAVLYIAEKYPTELGDAIKMGTSDFVYKKVGEESFKKIEDDIALRPLAAYQARQDLNGQIAFNQFLKAWGIK